MTSVSFGVPVQAANEAIFQEQQALLAKNCAPAGQGACDMQRKLVRDAYVMRGIVWSFGAAFVGLAVGYFWGQRAR